MSAKLIDHLFASSAHAEPCESVQAWWPRQRERMAAWSSTIEHAIAGGFAADRAAWAFGAGYQAALCALDPSIPKDTIACLCVTESGGNSPRAIESTLEPGTGGHVLNGRKKWSTLGPDGTLLLIAARISGTPSDRALIKIARVRASAPGVHIVAMPPTRFVPEMPHAEVHLDHVVVRESDLLTGDGYDKVVKPFRSIEDIHVSAAILGYLVGEGRRLNWPAAWLADASVALLAFITLAAQDPSIAANHIALEGALRRTHALAAEADGHFARHVVTDAARRWQRDRPVMDIAGRARQARFARACERLGLAGAVSG